MRYFNGFSLQNEENHFSDLLIKSEQSVAGFSYGAQRAFEYVYESKERIDRLVLLSPAFFQTEKSSFTRTQLRYFKAEKEAYVKQFLENVSYPSEIDLSKHLELGSQEELNALLTYVWEPSKMQEVLDRGTTIEIFLGEEDKIIDEVLVQVFRAPRSYTGEDSIEISCHGSTFIQQRILEMVLAAGARLAEPGEFSMRAFLNGKFDLSQAEAVADLIASESETAHQIAMRQLRGTYSNRIKELRTELLNFASLIELELDFSEEDVEFADRGNFISLINRITEEIDRLIHSFKVGNVLKEGIPVAIAGKPNVGKSTLLNALLHEDKAIVSDIPGTTRDVIEDQIKLSGTIFRFIDTAGIRHSADTIEQIGIERTYQQIEKASIVLYMIEARPGINTEMIKAEMMYDKIEYNNPEQKVIVLINKSD
jgi:tRNA modification GTPase TrmE